MIYTLIMNKGFTLIELLVVIAIIGILSSVVLSSVNLARSKGIDASVKANLAGVRSQAEIYYDSNGDFGALFGDGAGASANCPNSGDGTATIFEDDSVALAQLDDSEAKSGSTATCLAGDGVEDMPDASGAGDAITYAISIPLKSDPLLNWCVSSTQGGMLGTAQLDASYNAVCVP